MHESNFLIKIFFPTNNLIFHKLAVLWKINCLSQLEDWKRWWKKTLVSHFSSITFHLRSLLVTLKWTSAMSSAKKALETDHKVFFLVHPESKHIWTLAWNYAMHSYSSFCSECTACIKILIHVRKNLSLYITTFSFYEIFWQLRIKKEKQVFSSGNVRITYPGKRKSLYKLCFILNTFNIIWSIIWMKSFSVSNGDERTVIQSIEQMKKVFMNSKKEEKRRDLVNETFLLNYLQHVSSLFLVV